MKNEMTRKQKNEKPDLPEADSHTITKENIFLKQTHSRVFYKETECQEYINSQQNLFMFGEDINGTFAKRYIATNYKTIYLLSNKKKFHLYEYFQKDDKIKLYLDIDIKSSKIPKESDKEEYFESIIEQCIEFIKEKLEPYAVADIQTIILSSCREDKLSAHIIFPNVVFENVQAMKFFITNTNSHLIENHIIDPVVYRKGCFRLLWNSKYGINKNLEFYRSHNYNYQTEAQLFNDCLLKNIGEDHFIVPIKIPENVKIIKKQKPKNTNIDLNNNGIINHPVSIIKKYLDLLDVERASDYNKWLSIGMVLHNCNPNEECFDLWDQWSKNSESYDSKSINAYKWNSFRFGYYSIGTLKYFAKMDKPDKYGEIEYSLEKPSFESIKFEKEYLLNDTEEKIKDKKSFVSKYILDWMNKKIKTLAIKSIYNTGKTKLIKKIMQEFNFNRVLFISYRQTLTFELYSNFKELGVANYLDRNYKVKKIICQIESLHKLLPEFNFIGERKVIPIYDLIVIDEVESILSHFRSTTIQIKDDTFNLMRDMVFNAEKLLVLDGDFHNRAYDFIKFFGDSIILENTIKKDKRHFIFTNNKHKLEKRIDDDLKSGKRLVVDSMSSKLATYLYNKYKDIYKTVLHCAKSDDADKAKLKNVNEFWSSFQLVIYSPSVEAGVNFCLDHFDRIYVLLSSKSTSPRGLSQMISRVRKIKDANIMVYLNNLPFREKSNFYCYDELKEYITEMHAKYLKPKVVHDVDINKMVIKYEFDLYAEMLVHNETEAANKTKNLFVPYFIKLLTEKGHTYELDKEKRTKCYDKDTILKKELLDAPDIDEEKYNAIKIKQINNKATKEDKILAERFLFKKDWKVEEITNDFLDKYYGKTEALYNLRFLFDNKLVHPYNDKENGDLGIDFDEVEKNEKIQMIDELIKKLGYIKANIGKEKLDKATFEANIKKVTSESQLFCNPNKSQPLFGYDKKKICKIQTIKQFMGFANTLLADWGLVLLLKRKITSKLIKKKKITVSQNYYLLNYLEQINDYI